MPLCSTLDVVRLRMVRADYFTLLCYVMLILFPKTCQRANEVSRMHAVWLKVLLSLYERQSLNFVRRFKMEPPSRHSAIELESRAVRAFQLDRKWSSGDPNQARIRRIPLEGDGNRTYPVAAFVPGGRWILKFSSTSGGQPFRCWAYDLDAGREENISTSLINPGETFSQIRYISDVQCFDCREGEQDGFALLVTSPNQGQSDYAFLIISHHLKNCLVGPTTTVYMWFLEVERSSAKLTAHLRWTLNVPRVADYSTSALKDDLFAVACAGYVDVFRWRGTSLYEKATVRVSPEPVSGFFVKMYSSRWLTGLPHTGCHGDSTPSSEPDRPMSRLRRRDPRPPTIRTLRCRPPTELEFRSRLLRTASRLSAHRTGTPHSQSTPHPHRVRTLKLRASLGRS